MLAEGSRVASTNVPVRTTTPRWSSWRVTILNTARFSPRRSSSARKRTKAVRSGVASSAAKPQNRLPPVTAAWPPVSVDCFVQGSAAVAMMEWGKVSTKVIVDTSCRFVVGIGLGPKRRNERSWRRRWHRVGVGGGAAIRRKQQLGFHLPQALRRDAACDGVAQLMPVVVTPSPPLPPPAPVDGTIEMELPRGYRAGQRQHQARGAAAGAGHAGAAVIAFPSSVRVGWRSGGPTCGAS